MNSYTDKALAYFKEGAGFNCAQSVLAAFASDLGLAEEEAFRVAAAFGGGVGRSGEICGAVSGALMVLGLRFGAVEAGDQETKKKVYARAGELMASFREKHGTLHCRELLGYDIGTSEGLKKIRDLKLAAGLCTGYIRDAILIVEKIMGKG